MTANPALNRTARKLRLRVPSSLRSSAAGLSSYEALGNAVMVLPAGIAAVVAFILVFRGKPYA